MVTLAVLVGIQAAECQDKTQAPTPSQSLAPAKPSAAVPLPATEPTAVAAVQAVPQPQASRTNVRFADGQLSVDAANSSLNGVLREVAAKAGIKITGSVAEERIFGYYGPASPAAVLAELLEGTGSNMLLVDDPQGASVLVLTPRNGSPTPPNSNGSQEASLDGERAGSRYVPPIQPFQAPRQGRGPLFQQQAPLQASPDDSTDTSQPQQTPSQPTPAQIYEQLQRASQAQNPGQTSPPPE